MGYDVLSFDGDGKERFLAMTPPSLFHAASQRYLAARKSNFICTDYLNSEKRHVFLIFVGHWISIVF